MFRCVLAERGLRSRVLQSDICGGEVNCASAANKVRQSPGTRKAMISVSVLDWPAGTTKGQRFIVTLK